MQLKKAIYSFGQEYSFSGGVLRMSDSLVEEIGSNLSFGGQQLRYRHHSNILNCDMTFSIYLPPQAKQAPVPVLYWLSG